MSFFQDFFGSMRAFVIAMVLACVSLMTSGWLALFLVVASWGILLPSWIVMFKRWRASKRA